MLADALREAVDLIVGGDSQVWSAAGRTLAISLSAVAGAAIIGLPLGTALAVHRFPGRGLLVGISRAGMAMPTVVLGLVGFALLKREGPLGSLGLLYTPTAIAMGEFLLALPIITSLTHGAVRGLDPRADRTARTLGAGLGRRYATLVSEARTGVLLGILTALARCMTELGIAILVGGNIASRTRTLPTATALETSRGAFERGLAMGLILLVMAVALFVAMTWVTRERRTGVAR